MTGERTTTPLTTLLVQKGLKLGRYRLIEEIGRGGGSVVWAAHDDVLDMPVGLKVLRPDAPRDLIARFKNEIAVSRRVNHPGIIRIFDLHDDGDVLYLTMEQVQGQSLGTLMNEGPMPPERALAIARAILEAVAACHAHGVVHGDLKPGNVMVRARAQSLEGRVPDEVVIVDLDAARVDGDDNVRENIVGSPHYLAPEVWRGAGKGPAADIFAVGVLLYGCLTGTLPFAGNDPAAVALSLSQGPPAAPSAAGAQVGADVDAAVLRALAKRPEDRFGSAEEFLTALLPQAAPAPATNTASPSWWQRLLRVLRG